MPDLPPLRATVLLNPNAGTVTRLGRDAVRRELAVAFARNGITPTVEFLSGDEMRSATQKALDQVRAGGTDIIVGGGGDGTISTIANVLAGSEISLGVLPLGTLNHFAKDLDIPSSIDGAVDVIGAGNTRRVDVGQVDGHLFINNSSIGLYPHLVIERERSRRHDRLSKWAAMFLAGLRVLRHLPLFRLRVRVEGVVEPCRSPILFIANNEYRLMLPDFGRRMRLDGGELCVYVTKVQSRMRLILLALRCLAGLFDRERDIRILKGKKVEISARRGRLLVALDGEVQLMKAPLRYEVRPGALRVFAPTAASA